MIFNHQTAVSNLVLVSDLKLVVEKRSIGDRETGIR